MKHLLAVSNPLANQFIPYGQGGPCSCVHLPHVAGTVSQQKGIGFTPACLRPGSAMTVYTDQVPNSVCPSVSSSERQEEEHQLIIGSCENSMK